MMYKPLNVLLLLYATTCSFAQTIDLFSDGNFSSNPTWVGDDGLFWVNPVFQLQSRGTIAKDISLSTAVTQTTEMEWQCWVRFNLSPSTSNFCRYYLLSSSPNLKGSLNGYYVQFGGVTGNTDSITLYKQKGTSRTRIVAGRPATVSKNSNNVRIKVLRDDAGNWQLFSDTSGGYSYTLEGTGTDTEFMQDGYLGFFVRFSASNASNYVIDDVYAGPKIVDTSPPVMDSVKVISATQLRVVFSEAVDPVSALDPSNYTILPDIQHPVSVEFETGNNRCVLLELNDALSQRSYQLTASYINDLNGNTLLTQSVPFSYTFYQARAGDIVISEFFPDPSPPVGLPEREFVELYNRSDKSINLTNWTISDGTTVAVIGDYELSPGAFVIVCSAAYAAEFKPFGAVAVVKSLPSLNNSADQIILRNPSNAIIHQLLYDISWYGDDIRKDGGYTLEMKNPNQLCRGKQNYSVSNDASGGTPGKQNSNWSLQPDTIAPMVTAAYASDSQTVTLVFSEPMDSLSLRNTTVQLNGNNVISRSISITRDTLIVLFSRTFRTNIRQTISISNVADCSGNKINPISCDIIFYATQAARLFDVLLHEIMADPDPAVKLPNAEYVELFNRSQSFISLKGWSLSDMNSSAKLPEYILAPDSFVVITSNSNLTKFNTPNRIGVSSFPSLGNDGDALTLKDNLGKVIHFLEYTSAAYRDNLKKNGGWSLELQDPLNPCGGDENLAASIHPSGGTPGFANSTRRRNRDKTGPRLLKTYPLTNHSVEITFNESMDSASLLHLTYYKCNQLPNSPLSIRLVAPDYRKAELHYSDTFQLQSLYRLMIDSVTDCVGNIIETPNSGDFGVAYEPDSGELLINEILFDPRTGGSDYVELINRTDRILDLKNSWIGNADENNQIKAFYPIDSTGWLVFPGSYIVLTADKYAVQQQYFTPNPQNIIQTQMPSYNNDAGRCVLLNASGKRLDQLDYTDKMHYTLLDTKDGVSLERIDFTRPSSDASNWTSASSTSGYGTPTYQNSQYRVAMSGSHIIQTTPEIFSPDGDGYDDHIIFSYQLPEPGYTGNLRIYDAAGNLVKHLLRNELLGTTGSFGWNGITDNGQKAPMGIYLYCFEAFNLKGDVLQRKSTLVVAAKLE